MRYGFTTGSCAAAAAKAAAYMLLFGKEKQKITIQTQKGIWYSANLVDIKRSEHAVSCAVKKDAGDDPDVTDGLLIYAEVTAEKMQKSEEKSSADASRKETAEVLIDGGVGVGRVTKPGLDQPVKAAAINTVPREMIKREVLNVCELADFHGILSVCIFVPDGEKIAAGTFNPRLGILGGISILGTSGIVEPMSRQAIVDTIRAELSQRRALGFDYVAAAPGNYGLDFMKTAYGYDLDQSVKCSNFIGKTVDLAAELGFRKMLLTGHIGKLIKVAGGIMDTHSAQADCRMELLTAFAAGERVEANLLPQILDCVTTKEAVRILKQSSRAQAVFDRIAERICYYLERRSNGRLKVDCILYENEFGELAKSREAEKWFILLAQDAERRI